ncbi:AT-rich interactive domain protein [Senna tora]|uniref:AT-rich interactive domain protein n=1 Tax=Senna tora TaxID=362788 RepID=A0A834W907_9FABA|nr:AT-rich interactive domain protein [Senna tora]
MAFATGSCSSGRILYGNSTGIPYTSIPHSLHFTLPFSSRNLHIVCAKKFSPRPGRLDGRNRRGSVTTEDEEERRTDVVEDVVDDAADGYFLPELPGDKPDFWEGPQWDALGFFVQYMWAFGVVFALIACGIAVATYNEGATDFKDTPAYKESIQSRELLEEPDASNSDVFESNPTEVAPSLD